MVKPYWNKWVLGLILLVSFSLPMQVFTTEKYSHFFVQITDAIQAVDEGDQSSAKALVQKLAEDFQKVDNHDSQAGKAVQEALKLSGEIKHEQLVSISKSLIKFDEEQHPIDEEEEKAKLIAKLAPQYQLFQAALDSQDIDEIKQAYKQLNTVWTRNESIVRKNVAHYGRVETAISFLRSAIETEPVNFTAIQSNFDVLQSAVQSFVNGEEVAIGSRNLTLADGIGFLKQALSAFESGEINEGSRAMKEFITIWPSIEGDISTRDAALYNRVESQTPVIMVKGQEADYQEQLQNLIVALSAIDTTASYNFIDAALILLREGLEALLIVLALVSSLLTSKQKKGLKWVYSGAGAGILTSVLVALALQSLFPTVSGATNREIIEGAVGIFAVIIMLLVGIWLHSKSSVKKWTTFMNRQMEKITATGSFISMFALAFLAVFREGAETILFYVGILPRISMEQLLLGIVLAVLSLILITVLMLRLTTKIVAHRVFFYLTWVMYGLAFKMLGVSIYALQLTGVFPSHLISGLPMLDIIGFYPTVEVVIPQLFFVVLVILITLFQREEQGRAG